MVRIRHYIGYIIGDMVRAKAFFAASFLIVLILGFSMIYYVWGYSVNETKKEELRTASIAAAGFGSDSIESLTGDESDLTNKDYLEVKNSLQEVVSIHDNVQFAYIFKMKNDRIYFAADSEPANSEDYSPPGQEYLEASARDKQPFYDGKPAIAQGTDRWGTWVSVLIPMKDRETGEILAVFGMDYTVDKWYERAMHAAILAVVTAVCILLLYFSALIIIRINISLSREKRKLSETNEKLLKEEELFRTVFEQSPVGIGINNGGTIEYNAMFEKIVGRSNEEVKAIGWASFTHPEDLQIENELYEKFISGEIGSYAMNKRYFKPNGDTVWANITVSPLIVNRKPESNYLCLVEDITERVKAERELQENERSYSVLLSNLPGMAYRCKYDRGWTMLFVSQGCYDLTGYPSSSLLNNKEVSFKELISAKYREYLWEKWIDVVEGRTKLAEEYEIITASGEVKWVFEQGQAVYDEEGNAVALEGLIIDITDRKKKEEEILFLNYHDFLTGIYNRRFLELMKERMDRADFLPLSVMLGDINGLKLVNDALGHAQGDILIAETAKIIQSCCRENDIVARTGGDEFIMLMPFTNKESANGILDKIKRKCEEYNRNLSSEAYAINISLGFATKESENEHLDGTIRMAEDSMYKRKMLEHKSSHSVIISSIKATIHEKSHETQEHAERLTHLSKELGKKMRLTQQELDELELVATLHDIGKVGVDDRILNKPGKLDEIEWIEMKKHSEIGYRIAMSSPDLVVIADEILSLHERWDGNGYPQGLKGEEIPLLSRIVSVVDAYDAMTEDRTYRKSMSGKEAAQELRKNAGSQFDPKIVKLFLEKVLPNENGKRRDQLNRNDSRAFGETISENTEKTISGKEKQT